MSGVRAMQQQEMQLDGGGKLAVIPEGEYVRFEVFRPDDARGLYKAWLKGQKEKLLLGTLVPEKGGLYLRRRVSRRELERQRCWPVLGGETVLAFPFGESGGTAWIFEEHPERLVRDAVLQKTLQGKHMMLHRGEEGFCLAERFDPAKPFPLVPLFCFARAERVEGNWYVLFRFDRKANPVMPHNGSNPGEK